MTKRSCLTGAVVAVTTALGAAPAQAGRAANSVSGYVEFMSNYVGRGLSQSVGNPSVQAELDLTSSSGFYAGVDGTSINWIDELYPGDSVSLEIDLYAGYREDVHDWIFKGGLLRIQFPGRYAAQHPAVERPDTTEAFGFIGWRWFSAKFNYALTNAFGTPDSRGSWYLDLSASVPLGSGWSTGGHIGRKESRGTDPESRLPNARFSYTDYRLSVEKALSDGVSIALDYWWTNADPRLYTLNGYNVAGHFLVLTLTKTFE